MAFDPACLSLARIFLGDKCPERLTRELAQHIQSTIEDWLVTTQIELEKEKSRRAEAGGRKLDTNTKR